MYKITCCRRGNENNYKRKGLFNKEFNTISDFVKFYKISINSLYFPYFDKELTKKELAIFYKKLKACS